MQKMIHALQAKLNQMTAFGVALLFASLADAQSLKETADWLRDLCNPKA